MQLPCKPGACIAPTCSTKAEEESDSAAPMTTASSTVRSSASEAGACSTFSRNCGSRQEGKHAMRLEHTAERGTRHGWQRA